MSTRAAINSTSRPSFPYLRDSRMWLVLACLLLYWCEVNGQSLTPAKMNDSLGVKFANVARQAGLTATTIYGGEHKNKYLLETTGAGAAFIDYDNDGWPDIFLVSGTRLDGLSPSLNATNRLYRNNGNGTFTDVTEKSGLVRTGWGQGVCVGDYDNNGSLDLFVASYIDLDLKTAPLPETGPCLYKGVTVACGPPGLTGGVNTLYRNNGDGTFADVSEKAGIRKTNGTYGLSVLVADFDNDAWPDIYVANDSAPAALYHNNKNGTFTDVGVEAGCAFSIDGKPQAGMGVTAGDYDRDGWLDIFKTNFSGDTSTLYHNTGKAVFDDVTFPAGIGITTRWLGWGCGFVDADNNGWLDVFLVNGHVYPEVEKLTTEAGYAQRKVLYRNLENGRFEDVSEKVGGVVISPASSRGCAFGDYDNDGDIDILINPVNAVPELLRCDSANQNNWITIKTIGVKSNRDGIGARIRCVTDDGAQIDEVRSGGSYYSQNDLRVHFGLGKVRKVKTLEIRWPS